MIPRTVHQIWLGGNRFPELAENWREGVRRFLPDWNYKLWTDADLPELAAAALCGEAILNDRLGMGIRPDLVRYEILRQHGGLYLDHDMELLGQIDEIMVTDCVHFGFYFDGPKTPGCAILASPAGHPFWEMHLRRIRAVLGTERPDNPWEVLGLTGPEALERSLGAWLNDRWVGLPMHDSTNMLIGWIFEHGDVVGWSRDAVYPYFFADLAPADFRNENYPLAYAAHHWQGEWFREDAEFKQKVEAEALIDAQQNRPR